MKMSDPMKKIQSYKIIIIIKLTQIYLGNLKLNWILK